MADCDCSGCDLGGCDCGTCDCAGCEDCCDCTGCEDCSCGACCNSCSHVDVYWCPLLCYDFGTTASTQNDRQVRENKPVVQEEPQSVISNQPTSQPLQPQAQSDAMVMGLTNQESMKPAENVIASQLPPSYEEVMKNTK
ncbi:hypothetical protein PPYR_00609 [Photinus pyralis]|uniref:Uncharacterized protein n=1 Tax=Photinus pyralis TaxID=7054 RepID=A0A1Y1MLD5_PHOPY|nr:uncharacterized protein LOC116181951 [Photinus pyralis]KAB0803639.1 hypothetical protein PPYR_00609 [Photinus pyralis]